jgi:hypothetical protein
MKIALLVLLTSTVLASCSTVDMVKTGYSLNGVPLTQQQEARVAMLCEPYVNGVGPVQLPAQDTLTVTSQQMGNTTYSSAQTGYSDAAAVGGLMAIAVQQGIKQARFETCVTALGLTRTNPVKKEAHNGH